MQMYKINPNYILIEISNSSEVLNYFRKQILDHLQTNTWSFQTIKVAECITGEGRRIHKVMEVIARDQSFNFEIDFGFKDFIFVKTRDENNDKENSEKL